MKSRTRKMLNFIMCISLSASMLSSTVMAMGDVSAPQVSVSAGDVSAPQVSVSVGDVSAPQADISSGDASFLEIAGIRELILEIQICYEMTESDVLLVLYEELAYIRQEMEGLENYEVMSEEDRSLYMQEALKQTLRTLLDEQAVVLDVSGSVNLGTYNSGGNLVLSGDTTASGQCTLSSGTLTIDLQGHDLTLTNANQASFMLNGDNVVLNIKDSVGGGKIYACSQLVWGYSGGTINLYSGILDGSKVTNKGQLGGCICLGRSNMGNHTFNMYGGTIRNFEASQYGGAVYVGAMFSGKKNVFNMYGGTIEDCNAALGSGVYVDDSGDGPGYFYIKGGTKQADGGEPKATIRCTDGQNAIYNYGYLGLEGVVDIDGIVYLNQNNWASTNKHFIKITGRLIVTGDGYIDIDSAYPDSGSVCPGHTVVENATQTESTGSVTISQQEFYTYSSYFINTTKGLMISAGFDPDKNELDGNNAPANWPTYQGDKYSEKYSYVDVMGQKMLIQTSDSPGDKRQMQNYNYLIYTERANPEEPYLRYYSVKMIKTDMADGNTLNGARFQLRQTHDADGVELPDPVVVGSSSATGDNANGLENGETYLYLPGYDGKLMLADGIYELAEIQTPDSEEKNYVLRNSVATLHIYHKLDESTGQKVSVVEVTANDKILTKTEQEINSSYGDTGVLIEREIVLKINNSEEEIVEKTDYKVRVEKYADAEYITPLMGAVFALQDADEPPVVQATGTTDEAGMGKLLIANGSEFTFSNGANYHFLETAAPDGYFLMNAIIDIKVDDTGGVLINDVLLSAGTTISSADTTDLVEHGSWSVSLSDEIITFQVYDEKMPPTWTLSAVKYGTKEIDALRLAGAKFTLFKIEIVDGAEQQNVVATAISSDGTDGHQTGELVFENEEGGVPKLACNSVYLLQETYAPLGYSLIGDLTMTVNEDCTAILVTQKGTDGEIVYGKAVYDAENRILALSIIDEAVYHMPETGGKGIYPLLLCSIGLMCISAFCWLLLSEKEDPKGKHNNI